MVKYFVVSVVLVLSVMNTCHATTIDVVASEWGYVQADAPDAALTGDRVYWVGMTGTGPWRLFMKFDLPAEIGSNSNITSVVYSQVSSTPDSGMDGKIRYVANDSWAGSTVTWNTMPTASGDEYAVDVVAGWVPRDVSGNVSGIFMENGGQTVTLQYRAASENPYYYNQVSFGSTDTPKLTIDYVVPEPATIGLLAIGAVSMLRKRK